jgi:hypothetical protein
VNKDKQTQITRRVVLQAGVFAIAAGLAGRATSQTKIAQNLVQYQDKPKGDQQCDKCMQFEAPNSCKVVDGKISSQGWCIAFAPKAK